MLHMHCEAHCTVHWSSHIETMPAAILLEAQIGRLAGASSLCIDANRMLSPLSSFEHPRIVIVDGLPCRFAEESRSKVKYVSSHC